MARKLFVTTALPYANGPFHIGHIMEYIQADIWVRFQRMQGNEVLFVCADDAHGAPIMLKARRGGHHARRRWLRASRPDRPQIPARLSHRLRSLVFDRFTGEHRALAGYLSATEEGRPHLRQAGRAVLRPRQGHVPGGPLHQGRMPQLPCEGPIRRRLRGVQHRQFAHRSHQSVLDAVRRKAGAEDLRPLFLQALRSASASNS